jgi:hypothetical protein
MAEVLYVPNPERVVTTNAWAFLHWLRITRRASLAGWAALQEWSVSDPSAFAATVVEFAGCEGAHSRNVAAERHTLADELLFADLRPDDRLFVAGPHCADPFGRAAVERASLLIAPAQSLAKAAFQRPTRANLPELRTIIATGGPMSPNARRRTYTWVKADVMLLARSGNTYWGNPMEPVVAEPTPTPAFFRQRPSGLGSR